MKFRTEYTPRKAPFLLNPEEPALLLGSCFSDYVGKRMRFCRWEAISNPCGSLYNPSSISKILRIATRWDNPLEIIRSSIVTHNQLYASWLADTSHSGYDEAATIDKVYASLNDIHQLLQKARTLIVTFGTAWTFELRERPGYVVTNCHKLPPDTFMRRRLSIKEIVDDWTDLLSLLKDKYPELKVIITVSPVRHLKDGFEGNSRSKAILQLACEQICGSFDHPIYFPAFEIVNDDLRDYRFYDTDMVHPSDEAVAYIWEIFQHTFLSEASIRILKEGEKVTKRLNHRPIISPPSALPK